MVLKRVDLVLGNIAFDRGDYGGAATCWNLAMEVFSAASENHPATNATRLKLSTILMKQGRFREAT